MMSRSQSRSSGLPAILLYLWCASFTMPSAWAAVTATGNVTPTPPSTGGSVTGTLFVAKGNSTGDIFFGSMTVNGGSVLTSSSGVIGDLSGAIGQVDVTGAGSQWNPNLMTVGNGGNGILIIEDTASMRVGNNMMIGQLQNGYGQVFLDGPNTLLQCVSTLEVGSSGLASLIMTDGSLLRTRNTFIGRNSGSDGRLELSGSQTLWSNTSNIVVGDSGQGELEITSGARVRVTGTATIGSLGQVHLDDGYIAASSITNSGWITGSGQVVAPLQNQASGEILAGSDEILDVQGTVTNAGRLQASRGELTFLGGVTNQPTGQIVAQQGSIRFRGGLTNQGNMVSTHRTSNVYGTVMNTADGTIAAVADSDLIFYDEVTNAGIVQALAGSTIVFTRDLDFSAASSLAVQLPLLEDDHDDDHDGPLTPIQVAGAASLAGGLDVSLEPGLVPTAGESFLLVEAANGLSGTFDQVTLPPLTGGLDWSVAYLPNSLVLSVGAASSLSGDYNGNGTVEQGDLDLVLLNWGAAGAPPPAGWVNDLPVGPIDQAELDRILLNWGATANVTLAGSNVPEPTGLAIALLAACATSVLPLRSRDRCRVRFG